METSVEEFLKTSKKVKADLIEIRADGLLECSPENVHQLLKELKKTLNSKIILTVRMKEEGGQYRGSEDVRKKIILGSLHLIDLVDIELRSEILNDVVSSAKANKIGVIVSYHDFEKTPPKNEIEKIIRREKKAGADFAKVAFQANSSHDVLELLWAADKMSKEIKVVTISMGTAGSISRVAAQAFGSSITYASTRKKTAPGQLSLEETRKILNILGENL
jgi:3-dehydroquinate dehydratase-1